MGRPAWMDRRKTQNVRSRRQEAARAEEIGGRVQPGSGSSWRAPQDIRSDTYMEQIKYTDKDRYSLCVDELKGLIRDADLAGRIPRLVIEFSKHNLRVVIEEG